MRRAGISVATQVNGFSGSAVRLETTLAGQDTIESYLVNTPGTCSNDPSTWPGGMAFTEQPSAITGYYRYNLPGNDTALLLVVFKNNFTVVGMNLIKIRGTGSQMAWTSFSFPLALASAPDTVIIAAASSNLLANVGIEPGSFLELDQLAFTNATQPIPNGDFENWSTQYIDIPNNWEHNSSAPGGVIQSPLSYAGSSAVLLETMTGQCGDFANPSGITNGNYTDFGTVGGVPFSQMNDTLTGYYTYSSPGIDTAIIMVTTTNNGSFVGGYFMQLLPAGSYTYFAIPVQSFSTPDTLLIEIQSSNWSNAVAGSTLHIDNLQLMSSPLGLFPDNNPGLVKSIYPVPAKDVLTIDFGHSFSGVNVIIYDATGRIVNSSTSETSSNKMNVNIANLPAGLYYCEVISKKGETVRHKFVKE